MYGKFLNHPNYRIDPKYIRLLLFMSNALVSWPWCTLKHVNKYFVNGYGEFLNHPNYRIDIKNTISLFYSHFTLLSQQSLEPH